MSTHVHIDGHARSAQSSARALLLLLVLSALTWLAMEVLELRRELDEQRNRGVGIEVAK